MHPFNLAFLLLILCGLLSAQDFYPERDAAIFFTICGIALGAFLTEIHSSERQQKLIFEWKLYRLERKEYKKYLKELKAYEDRQNSLKTTAAAEDNSKEN